MTFTFVDFLVSQRGEEKGEWSIVFVVEEECRNGKLGQPRNLLCTLLQSLIEEMRKPSAQYFLMFDLCDSLSITFLTHLLHKCDYNYACFLLLVCVLTNKILSLIWYTKMLGMMAYENNSFFLYSKMVYMCTPRKTQWIYMCNICCLLSCSAQRNGICVYCILYTVSSELYLSCWIGESVSPSPSSSKYGYQCCLDDQ